MSADKRQQDLFQHIKINLSPHLSLVETVATLLDLSSDSAYRRIRGEKTLSFDELSVLASHFNISLDNFLHIQSGSTLFSGNLISRQQFDFENYLQGMVQQLTYFNSFKQKELFYHNKDVPIFHHFMFPELAAFKCYFWSRYNLNYDQFNRGYFLIADFIEIFNKTGRKISDLYLQIPSTEIWNLDCINTTIRQIDYYRESKIFKSKEDIVTVYECLDKLVDHIEKQVEKGVKFSYGATGDLSNVKYKVFVNEFILGDNTILIQLDNLRMVALNHNVINYIITRDETFINYTYQTLQTIIKKSSLISEVGEKERQLFFDGLRERIHVKKRLLAIGH